MKSLIGQIKEFFRPFPEPGSWAYNLHMWVYDIVIALSKHTVDKSVDEPSEEAGDDGRNIGETERDSDVGYDRGVDSVNGSSTDDHGAEDDPGSTDSDKSGDDELHGN